jgi:membrane protease YdiL (CAAX protease family)
MDDGKSNEPAHFLGRLLPPKHDRPVPYSGLEAFLIVFLMAAFWPAVGYLLVTETKLGSWLYGPDAMNRLHAKDRQPDDLIRERVGLSAALVAFPFQLLTAPLLLRFLSGTRPYHFGLTTFRLRDNVVLGLLGWMALTPPVLTLNWAVTTGFQWLAPNQVKVHGFARLSKSQSLTGIELGMIIFLATVAAPVVEEMLFRGVVQSWLDQHERGSHIVMGMVFILALPMQTEKWEQLLAGDWLGMAPVLFVVLMVPEYLWVWSRQRSPGGTAIYATSMLFAIFHAGVWPSPIPLFVLALGLGWLARRTGSLIGPMVLHSLFNGVACVQMLLER